MGKFVHKLIFMHKDCARFYAYAQKIFKFAHVIANFSKEHHKAVYSNTRFLYLLYEFLVYSISQAR